MQSLYLFIEISAKDHAFSKQKCHVCAAAWGCVCCRWSLTGCLFAGFLSVYVLHSANWDTVGHAAFWNEMTQTVSGQAGPEAGCVFYRNKDSPSVSDPLSKMLWKIISRLLFIYFIFIILFKNIFFYEISWIRCFVCTLIKIVILIIKFTYACCYCCCALWVAHLKLKHQKRCFSLF